MSLLTPPPGVDPYTFYSEVFRPPFHPSPGYQARLIVLGVFIASLPISAALLLGLHVLKTRRRGEKLWIFKRVKRNSGSYIVGARTPLLAAIALIVAVTLGGGLYTGWRFTSHYALTGEPFNDFMYCYWILSFIVGWTYSCSNFQTWVLIGGERQFYLSPFVANLIFFGGLFLGSSVLLGMCVYGGLLTDAFYDKQDVLFDYLEEAGRNYNGTFDNTILEDLGPLVSAYGSAAQSYFSTFPSLLAVFSASPAPVILINLSAMFLWLILRRQGRENAEVGAITPTRPTTNTSGGAEGISATSRRHKEMKAIEHGFLVDAIAVSLWSSSILVGAVWTAAIFKNIENAGWARIEAGIFLPVWSASVPLSIAMVAQTILAWRGLPPPRAENAEGSDPAAPDFPRLRSMDETRAEGVQSNELISGRGTEKAGGHKLLEFGEDEGREPKDEEEEGS